MPGGRASRGRLDRVNCSLSLASPGSISPTRLGATLLGRAGVCVWLALGPAACGDDAGTYVVSAGGEDAGARPRRPGKDADGGGPGARDAGGVPVSSAQSVVVGGDDEDAGADVGASDPAPGIDEPGLHRCETGPVVSEGTFKRDLGDATSTILSGTVTGADGDGRFYVESAEGQSLGGAVRTNPNAGVYKVEVPLFCGAQTVKLVWENADCKIVVVYEITTDACETDIRVTLTWDALGRDFELHLVQDAGRINDDATDCTWTSCIGHSPDWGVVGDSRDDPSKDVDNTGSHGPENIFLERASAGSYTVMVEHWGAGDPRADGEVTINAGGRKPLVIRFFNLAPYVVFTAAQIDWPGGAVRVIGDFHDCSANWSGGCRDPIP